MIALCWAAVVCAQTEPQDVTAFRATARAVIVVYREKPPEAAPAGALAYSKADGIAVVEAPPGQAAVKVGDATIDLAKCPAPAWRDALAGVTVTSEVAGMAKVVNSGAQAVVVLSGDRALILGPGMEAVKCPTPVVVVTRGGQGLRWTAPEAVPVPVTRPSEVQWKWSEFGAVRFGAAGGGVAGLFMRGFEAEVECTFVGANIAIADNIEYDVDAFGVWGTADFGPFDVTLRYVLGEAEGDGDGTVIIGPSTFTGDSEMELDWSQLSLTFGRMWGGLGGGTWNVGFRTDLGFGMVWEKVTDVKVLGTDVDCSDRESYVVVIGGVALEGRFEVGNGWRIDTRLGGEFDFGRGVGFGLSLGVEKSF